MDGMGRVVPPLRAWRERGALLRGLARAAVIVGSGYVCAASAVAGLGGLLVRLGMVRSEAVVLALMTGPWLCLGLLLWAFASLRNGRAAVLLTVAVLVQVLGVG